MLQILTDTILPVFSIIVLGYLLKAKKVIGPAYGKPANQIVYYLSLPAMLFNTTSKAPFAANFDLAAVACMLGATALLPLVGLGLARVLNIPRHSRGTFLQSGFHGNLGLMSNAIAYYALGESQFARTVILSSFLMVGQNFLSSWVLTSFSGSPETVRNRWAVATLVLRNPIILSVTAGVLYSASGLAVPLPVSRALDILSGMAFPSALILIGASLSFGTFRSRVRELIGIGAMKLIGLPLAGYTLMSLAGVPQALILPATLLLAAPPATVTYVMASELGGDPELAATSISALTLLSALSYSMVLAIVGG